MEDQSESIFSLFTELRALSGAPQLLQDALAQWRPPQFLLVGVEGCGKATILERLTAMPLLPHVRGRFLPCAFHVLLRYGLAEHRTLEVVDMSSGAVEVLKDPFDPWECDGGQVAQEMQRLVERHGGSHGMCTSHGLAVRITGPTCPHLDLINMPGLVRKPKERNIGALEILEKHFGRNADLIHAIAVMQALDTPSTNLAMAWLGDTQCANRTCGVFTMCDKLGGDGLGTLCQLARQRPENGDGQAGPETFGWVATMSKRLAKDRESLATQEEIASQAQREQDYFQKAEDLEELWRAGNCCIGTLLARIRTMYKSYLNTTLGPALAFQLGLFHQSLQFQYVTLGMPEAHQLLDPAPRRELVERVARAIASNVEEAMPALLDQVVRDVLMPLRRSLLDLVAPPPVPAHVPVFELDDKWYGLRGVLGARCEAAAARMVELVSARLQEFTECREPVPPWPSREAHDLLAGAGARAPLVAARFPHALQDFRERTTGLLDRWRGGCVMELGECVGELFAPMSSYRTIATDLDAVPATVAIRVRETEFVDNVMAAMFRQVELLAKVLMGAPPQDLAEQADLWKECCAPQRESLMKQMDLVAAAFKSLHELPRQGQQDVGGSQEDMYEHPSWDESKSQAVAEFKEAHGTSLAHHFWPAHTIDAPPMTQADTDTQFTVMLHNNKNSTRGSVVSLDDFLVDELPVKPFVVSVYKTGSAQTKVESPVGTGSVTQSGSSHVVRYAVNRGAFSHSDPPRVTVRVALHGAPVLGTPFTTAIWAPHWGDPVCSFGDGGEGEGQFQGPTYVATHAGFVYVSDCNNHRVAMFRKPPPDMGQSGKEPPEYYASWGTKGSEDGELKKPRGVAARGDQVYVVDCGNTRVQVFGNGEDGGKSGEFLFKFGSSGRGPGQFNCPEDICLDDRHAYISDFAAKKVLQFARSDGEFVKDFVVGNGVRGIDVDENCLYVAANSEHFVFQFDKETGQQLLSTRLSYQPCGLSVDTEHIYMTTHSPDNLVYVYRKQGHERVRTYSPNCNYLWGCAVCLHALYLVDNHKNIVKVVR